MAPEDPVACSVLLDLLARLDQADREDPTDLLVLVDQRVTAALEAPEDLAEY